MDKKQKEARRRQEDAALNRGLIWVGAAIVLELLMMFVKRYYVEYNLSSEVPVMLAIHSVLSVLRIVGALGLAACVVWLVLRLRQGGKAELPIALAAACGALAVCAHVSLAYQAAGVQMLFLLIPAWAALALVYYLYQKDFFLAAVATGMSVLGLWFVRFGGGFSLEALLVAAAIAVVLVLTLWLKKQGGVVELGGVRLRVLPKSAAYMLVLVSCAASLAAVLLALVMGSAVAYYLLFLMVAWLFALLVYYTVKMM